MVLKRMVLMLVYDPSLKMEISLTNELMKNDEGRAPRNEFIS